MYKIILGAVISLLLVGQCKAQSGEPMAFYMDKTGLVADSMNHAVYIRSIYPQGEDSLYTVKDFYMNGKPKLIAKSISGKNLFPQGSCIQFFPNGKRKSITNYEKGQLVGDDTQFYPNGKPYTIVKHIIDGVPTKFMFETLVSLIECRDSTGSPLAQEGNGTWIKFDEDFKKVCEGPVINGLEEGEWTGTDSTGILRKGIFKKGVFISGDLNKVIDNRIYTGDLDRQAMFSKSQMDVFRFLAQKIRYPREAREKNIQGRVLLTFIVEKDGSLTDIKIFKGMPGGLNEESLRVLKLSPKWLPATKYGLPVRSQTTLPISYALAND